MQKYVPIEKRSKKARKELAKSQRTTWGALNPVTRRPDDPKKYNRPKSRREAKIFDDGIFILQYEPQGGIAVLNLLAAGRFICTG